MPRKKSRLQAKPDPEAPVRQRRLSGKLAAAWVFIGLAMCAVLIPVVLGLPQWIEFEIVLVFWWAIWLGVLTYLLYHGYRLSDDVALSQPRNWFSSSSSTTETGTGRNRGSGWGWDLLDLATPTEGCAEVLLAIVAAVALLFLSWFVIEIALPALIFLLFGLARGMMAQVVNDRHRCRGRPVRSFGWGFVWATVYIVPLAGAVWFVHWAVQQK